MSSTIHHIRCFRNIAAITTGTKNTAVTELILISVGANTVRAIPSQNSVITAPPRKHPGIRIIGFAVWVASLIRCGTAIPTNEIGQANAVTHADSRLDSKISAMRSAFTFTPIFLA